MEYVIWMGETRTADRNVMTLGKRRHKKCRRIILIWSYVDGLLEDGLIFSGVQLLCVYNTRYLVNKLGKIDTKRFSCRLKKRGFNRTAR
jgi:hypothetical protein